MQNLDFEELLKQRFRCCIHVSFSRDVLQQYPNSAEVLLSTWKSLEAKKTCPYEYRLDFDEPVFDESLFFKHFDFLANSVGDPSLPTHSSSSPWFKYLVEHIFNTTKNDPYLFLDIPICYIFVSTTPGFYIPPCPEWMNEYVKDVPAFNLVISDCVRPSSQVFVVKDATEESFFDFVLKITHYEAAPRVTSLREITENYVKNNWGGFKNTVFRLFGFNASNSRAEIILKLKRLADVCFGCGMYREAFNYYQQLYQELNEKDPPVGDSLYLMFAISAILIKSDIDVTALLNPILLEKQSDVLMLVRCGLVSVYYSTYNNKYTKTTKLYAMIHSYIKEFGSHLPYAFLSFPLIAEAISTVVPHKKAALYMYKASDVYSQIGLVSIAIILLWRAYHQIRLTGWPKLEHSILLKIASYGETPRQLQNLLVQRNLSWIPQTVEQLKKIHDKELIYAESVIIHEMVIPSTGFPHSPPPTLVSRTAWANIRKKLFPVVYHPSTEEFANTVWSQDTRQNVTYDYTVAVNEDYFIKFKMTPTLADGVQIHNLQLFVEPEGCVEVENYDFIDLKAKKQMNMKFTPKKVCQFTIRGIKFSWFNVSPVAILFSDSLRYEAIENYLSSTLTIESKPEISYLNLPVTIVAKANLFLKSLHNDEENELTTFHVVADSPNAIISLKEPKCRGFMQRWILDPKKKDQTLTFEVIPNVPGTIVVNIYISFANVEHTTRFNHVRCSFECREIHRLQISQHENIISIQPSNDIEDIVCQCAAITYPSLRTYDKSFNSINIAINEPIESFTGEKCTILVKRNFTGTIQDEIVNISHIFLKFEENEYNLTEKNHIIKISFLVLCLGNFDGLITLKQPNEGKNQHLLLNNHSENEDSNQLISQTTKNYPFNWLGKVKFYLKGPSKQKIILNAFVEEPCSFDIGQFLNIEYGKTKIKVAHTVEIK